MSWQQALNTSTLAFRSVRSHTRRRVKYVRSLSRLSRIGEDERALLEEVVARYPFRTNDYYLGLIDWSDVNDPIKQLIIPRGDELDEWGSLDASNEQVVTVTRGVQHKYRDTVLLLCNALCGGYCRYCFRKRLFMDQNDEVSRDMAEGIRYVAQHPEVTDVLLTGGDPLLMSTRRLRRVLAKLRAIQHVKIIRIGTKMPAFDPWRILDDTELQAAFHKYSTSHKRIYLMCHFDHPRELTRPAVEGIACALRSGLICVNQCPLIKGVNDDPQVLAEMYHILATIGCPPYYLFQGRPTAGNKPYAVPIVKSWQIFQKAISIGSGLSRRARFVMSHETGKFEILAVDQRYIYTRFHRAKNRSDQGRMMIFQRDDDAYWLDELQPA